MAFFIEANAQWQLLNSPCGTGIGSLVVNDSVVYAGGRFQTAEFFLSNDNGIHWQAINNGLPAQRGVGDFIVHGSSIYATTEGGLPYRANISDYIWHEAASGLPAYPQASHLIEHDSIVFLTAKSGLYVLGDSDNTWHPMNTGIPDTCCTLMTVQENCIFFGTCFGEIYYSTNNGSSWIEYNTSALPEIPVCSLIKKDSIMIIGSSYAIFRTTDQGNTWVMVTDIQNQYNVTDMIMDSAFIYASTFDDGILRSSDDGQTWLPANSGLLYFSVYDLAQGNGFLIAGTNGGIFKSFDQGNSWTICNDGLTNTTIHDLVYDGQSYFAGSYLGVFRSSDNGASWKLVLTPGKESWYINSLFCHDSLLFAGTYYLGYGTGSAGIFRSADKGDTWELVDSGLISKDILAINSKDSLLFAGTSGEGLFRSGDDGNSWTQVFSGETIYDITGTKDSVFFACYHGIYCSPDNGDTWTMVNNGLGDPWFFSLYAGNSKLFGGSGFIYRSAVNPVSWKKITKGVTLPASIQAIASNDSLVFFGDSRGVYVSSNNGDEWFLSDSGFVEPVIVLSLLIRDSMLYAGTYHGIWKRPLSELYMKATPDTLTLTFFQSSSARLFVHCKTQWSLQGNLPDWLSADALSGTGDGSITFTALETNPTELPRSAKLRLESPSEPAISFTVLQKSLAVSKDSLVLNCPSGSTDTLCIFSNTNWTFGGTVPAWLEISKQTGNGSDSVIFRALEQNPSEQPRTVELGISPFQAPLVKISVTQKGKQAGTGEKKSEPVRVYPVPSHESFCVESTFPFRQITVFSSDGTVLETREGTAGRLREMFLIRCSGVLFIRIETAKQTFMRKVVAY